MRQPWFKVVMHSGDTLKAENFRDIQGFVAIVFSAKFGGVTAQANNSQKFSTQNRIS